MSKLEQYQKIYDDAIKVIKEYQKDPKMSKITNWLLETDANPWGIFPNNGDALGSAENFAGLLLSIHHTLFDDGEICFPVIGGWPRIVFRHHTEATIEDCTTETERNPIYGYDSNEEIVFLKTIDEFIEVYDKQWLENMKNCFAVDVDIHGLDYAIEHYSKYKLFSQDWIDECETRTKELRI